MANNANVENLPTCCVYINGKLSASTSADSPSELYSLLRRSTEHLDVNDDMQARGGAMGGLKKLLRSPAVMIPVISLAGAVVAATVGAVLRHQEEMENKYRKTRRYSYRY